VLGNPHARGLPHPFWGRHRATRSGWRQSAVSVGKRACKQSYRIRSGADTARPGAASVSPPWVLGNARASRVTASVLGRTPRDQERRASARRVGKRACKQSYRIRSGADTARPGAASVSPPWQFADELATALAHPFIDKRPLNGSDKPLHPFPGTLIAILSAAGMPGQTLGLTG